MKIHRDYNRKHKKKVIVWGRATEEINRNGDNIRVIKISEVFKNKMKDKLTYFITWGTRLKSEYNCQRYSFAKTFFSYLEIPWNFGLLWFLFSEFSEGPDDAAETLALFSESLYN